MVDPSLLTRRRFIGNAAATMAAASGAGVLLSACGADSPSSTHSAASKAGATSLTVVNILPPQLGYAAEMIADLDGHFEREGVGVNVETARGSAPAIQSVLSNKALLSRVGMIETVGHVTNEGAPLVNVGVMTRVSPLAIVSSPDKPVNAPQDLSGKRIGIPSEGGTSETTLDILVSVGGLDKDDVPRQVTGFSPGTFELIRAGRIDGFVIGATQIAQMRAAVPEAVIMPTAKYVKDGECYITSKEQLDANKETIAAYLRATRAAAKQIVADKGFDKTLKTLRAKYDFDELKDDKVAKPWLQFLVDAWTKDGEAEILKTDAQQWKDIYAESVKVGAAKAGEDPSASITASLV
jgi:NitT/TauT family transport system substrate-binding protein